MIVILGYIEEIALLLIWYKYILVNELKRKHILKDSLGVLYNHGQTIIRIIFGIREIEDEKKENFIRIKKCLDNLFFEGSLFIVYFLMGPIFLNIVIPSNEGKIAKCIIYIVFLSFLLIGKLKEDTQKIAIILNEYTENVMIPIIQKPELIQIAKSNEIPVRWTKQKAFVFLGYLFLMPIMFIAMNYLSVRKEFQYIAVLVLVVIVAGDTFVLKKRKKITRERKDGIIVNGIELEFIKDEIVNMCYRLNIQNLECKLSERSEVGVQTKIKEDNVPQVEISNYFLNLICRDGAKTILLFTIGHELGHIYYKDWINIKKRMKRTNLIVLLGQVFFILIMLLLAAVCPQLIIWIIPLFLIEVTIGHVMCDIRYWEQIAELRADRLSIQICNGNKRVFTKFWKENSKRNDINKTNILSQFYRKYIKQEAHPSMYRRMELLEKREKWFWWEYIEHALVIIKWRVSNHGWNGV
ncbi:MAG: M48 family metalloprotease [Lachnospiraceae bacterium]|nr:M48 family metalloprotease [Lachnospiraceae bacterium]